MADRANLMNGERVISKKSLVNLLNHLNFQDKPITCHLGHRQGGKDISLNIMPQPTFGDYLVCLWPDEIRKEEILTMYRMDKVFIPDKDTAIEIAPDIRCITEKGLCIRLPESCLSSSSSIKTNRSFDEIRVRINQNSASVIGEITGLQNNTLTVIIKRIKHPDFRSFDTDSNINLAFVKSGKILFTGQYTIVDQKQSDDRFSVSLEPSTPVIHRFPPKKFRSSRYALNPTPDAVFFHPFTGKTTCMDVYDVSGAGFSVVEEDDAYLLLTGMVLHDIELRFAGAAVIRCSAQIVHRSVEKAERNDHLIRYGFAFTDMPLDHHLKLQSILHQRDNGNTRVCHPVDSDDLWDFFFETGFIYSKKYHAFTENKRNIKATYTKLYSQNPSIARHFIYQEKGKILGHMSMLRFYTNAWLIHHHAALKKSSIKAGLSVMNQVAWFCYNSMWLDECHMRYMFCYFRPENDFPNFFFNGFAEKLNDKKGCSTDTFAYYTFKKPTGKSDELPPDWKLEESTALDREDLAASYARNSGGLLIDAFDFKLESGSTKELDGRYRDAGFTKDRHLFSLRYKGDLMAVILVNLADIAINMSDLTSCVKIMVLDESSLPKDIVDQVLNRLSPLFDQKRFPVLIHPLSYADDRKIPYQKKYILWILNTRYSDHYFGYLDQVNALGAKKN